MDDQPPVFGTVQVSRFEQLVRSHGHHDRRVEPVLPDVLVRTRPQLPLAQNHEITAAATPQIEATKARTKQPQPPTVIGSSVSQGFGKETVSRRENNG
jgi:hypothetical protein